MKKLGLVLFTFAMVSCSAIPTPPVNHSHHGRMHNHSLPVTGIAHRHGAGAAGKMATPSRTATISSSVVYDSSSAQRSNSQPVTPRQNTPAKLAPRGLSFTKGDANCRAGSAFCNVCASNVQQQFEQAATGRINWRNKPWRFTWPQKYPPFGQRPLDIFDGVPAYALGIPDTHVQGFARTNSARFPFVGSHSHKRKGGVFVIKEEADGKKYLASLHPTKGRHPSGVQVIGKYLVYGDQGKLYFKDLTSANHTRGTSLKIPNAKYGGGMAVLKLSGDNLLLVTTGPGGQKARPRYNQFYHIKTQNSQPYQILPLGSSLSQHPSRWPKGLKFSENLSLVTECGTGDIYTVHTSGDEKGISAISGNGYWRLSKVYLKNGKPALEPINAFLTRQNMTNCNVRAAATVYVNPRHRLEFYCHGYAKDPDGSMFNVLGSSSRNADKFYFKAGTL